MKNRILILVVLLLCACARPVSRHEASADTLAATQYGMVQGFAAAGVKTWLGIPYAAPPVGELRFRRNQPPTPWQGVKKCVAFGNKPIQYMNMFGRERSRVPASEDCLYLNVWAPLTAAKEAKLPVFVWIYGGAYHMGEGSDPMYDGASFARDGVVFVNFNYRVGPLGFYDFSMYDKRFESNCGVSDQIAALRWVRDNIAAFGGDPNNVTIAGESAGGTGVYNMLASPAAKGLFQKAIAESGVTGNTESRRMVEMNNTIFFEKLGINPRTDMAKLLDMPAQDMLAAATFTLKEGPRRHPGIFMPGPVKDDLLPMHPWEAMAQGNARDVKVILGTNRNEGTLFALLGLLPRDWQQVEKMLRDNGAAASIPAVSELYANEKGMKKLTTLAGDRAFVVDMVKSADAQSAFNSTYVYRFDYAPLLPELFLLGAAHSTEISTALATNDHPFWLLTPASRREELTQSMHGAWLNFVKTGNPNGPGVAPLWPQYEAGRRLTYIFDQTNTVESNPHGAVYEVWKDIQLYQ